jgi:hypothetical protein
MVGVDDRRFDVKDILDKATYGWVAPPTKPTLVVEDTTYPRKSYLGKAAPTIAGGVFFIKKKYSFERRKHSYYHETRVWTFPCVIISQSHILLQGLFDQARETFDRYTTPSANTPFSTSTLGTSTTYTYAGIEKGDVSEKANRYELDCMVYLREQFVSVVVA